VGPRAGRDGPFGALRRRVLGAQLELVRALEHALRAAAIAGARIERLRSVVEAFADPQQGDPEDVLRRLVARARRALADVGPREPGEDRAEPATVTGWWCAECGNVDMPQPCIGVCVWRPAEWVNLALYERQRLLAEPRLDAARSFAACLARSAAVTPRAGAWERNRRALREQAMTLLGAHALTSPTPDPPAPGGGERAPEPVIRVHS
jgi:hypothetical protein